MTGDPDLTAEMDAAEAVVMGDATVPAEPIGYVVVTYDPRSRRPFVGFMHDSLATALAARDRMSTGPGERHVVAEVFEVEDDPHG